MLKGMGKTITHKQPISIADLRKMYDTAVLGTANPLALLRKVKSPSVTLEMFRTPPKYDVHNTIIISPFEISWLF